MRGYNNASSDNVKHSLTDLEAFDGYILRESTRAHMHMDFLYEGEVCLDDIRDTFYKEQDNIDTANLDLELRLSTLVEIIDGPRNKQADLEAVLKRLSEHHRPKIEEVESLFEERLSFMASSPIWEDVKQLVWFGMDIQQ